MRSIKFRVFDKDYRKMHIVGEDGHDSLTCWDGKIQYYNLQNGEGSGEHGSYILMQHTGLTDKNGKDIYEQDIVKVIDEFGDETIGKVEWGLSSKNYGTYPAFCIYEFESDMNSFSVIYDSGVYEIEVIGNIFQHPHLLEESK